MKKNKTYHFHTGWEEDFFLHFQSAFTLPFYHRDTKEGKCGAAFSDYMTSNSC